MRVPDEEDDDDVDVDDDATDAKCRLNGKLLGKCVRDKSNGCTRKLSKPY